MGAPGLIAEIAATSASLDLGDKMEAYAVAGVRDYLVWRTLETGFHWFILQDAEYNSARPNARGLIRSRVFPGLVLDPQSLLRMDLAKVLTLLRRGVASAAHKRFVANLEGLEGAPRG